MIILDTHIWIWWLYDTEQLTARQINEIKANENDTIGISAISCWEVAKLVEYGRLELSVSLDEFFKEAFDYPGMKLIELTPEIAIESTRLPDTFHSDPSDQIIVATARLKKCPLITSDGKILNYPHVNTIK